MKALINKLGLLIILVAAAHSSQAQSGTTTILKRVLDGNKHQLATDSAVTVQDSVYFDPAVQSKLDTPYKVRNVITFLINEYSRRVLPAQFTVTANVRIIYTKPDLSVDSIDKTLTLNYDSAQTYTSRTSFVFENAHRVKVQVLSVTTAAAPEVLYSLLLENEMRVQPVYKLNCTDDAIRSISSNTPPNVDSTDEISVTWPVVTGADEYDLEWVYIDSSALIANKYGNPVNPGLLFQNNASRVTLRGNTYAIPLMYDNGGRLYFRVRAVQQKANENRMETDWSSDFAGGLGSYSFCGHQRNLNWQSTVFFAENGRRKIMVQYYDGSLRARQTVTKDNSTLNTIIGESYYDYQGRPVIQVLPSPTLNTVIKYSQNFNTALNGAEYDKDQYDHLATPSDFLTASANPMGNGSGANHYYSSNNTDKNIGSNRFIPEADGYAFKETEYTQDNTGRKSRESGIGPVYKLGSNHETKYFYGTTTQDELDALFGTEVGNERHYFKNMIRDANGQYSISYLDMQGRIIATSLAGSPDSADLEDLESKIPLSLIDTLSRNGSNVIKDMVLESHQTKLVAVDGVHHFKYSLTPPVFQKKDCDSNTVCYNGLYDLQITITDDAFNQRLGGKAFDTLIRNFNPEVMVANCDAPQSFLVEFSLFLPKGSYAITKRLTINKQGLDFYRENIFLSGNVCKTLEDFMEEQRVIRANEDCIPDCQSCKDSVGTWADFRDRYMQRTGVAAGDSASFRGEARTAYTEALDACKALCDESTEADEIRKAMLLDMSAPSGQYATVSDSLNTFSIFYHKNELTLPPYRRDTVSYYDETGNQAKAYDNLSNTMVSPKNLKSDQFADQFQTSWAESLLKFHPEYCKLLEMEKHKGSLAWDRMFEATDTYAEAKLKGYLNPTANSSYYFPVVAAGQDSLSLESTALKNKLEAALTNYNNQAGTNILSMWSVATAIVKCNGSATACMTRYNTPAKAFSEADLCTGDLDMAWRSFRQLYLTTKSNIINELVNNARCNGIPAITAAQIQAKDKQPHFNNAKEALNQYGLSYMNNTSNSAAAKDSAQKALERSYEDNCRSYAKMWVKQLAPCKYPQSVLDNDIIPKLIAVCKEGSDLEHPFGASSVKPASGYAFRTFEEVLAVYNSSRGITDPLICNAELITAPNPYDKQPGYVNKAPYIKPNDCECNNLKNLQREYNANKRVADTSLSTYVTRTRGVKIAQADLDELIDACSGLNNCTYFNRPIGVPVLIQCNIAPPCVPCKEIDTLYNRFVSAFPGILPSRTISDSTQQLKNTLFENYMNNKLGFSMQVWEYLDFRDSCTNYAARDTTVCEPRGIQKNKSYDNAGAKDVMRDIRSTSDGGFIMAGGTTVPNSTNSDAYLIKTDAAGVVEWAKTYAGSAADALEGVRQTTDGGYITIGTTRSISGQVSNALIMKLSSSGDIEWSRRAGGFTTSGDHGVAIIQTSNGGYAFGGRYNYNGGSATDWMFGSLDSDGDMVWFKQVGSDYGDDGLSIAEDNDTLLVSAGSNLENAQFDGIVLKINKQNGSFIKAFRYSVNGRHDWAGNIVITPAGYKIAFLSSSSYSVTDGKCGILDLTKKGQVLSCKTINLPGNPPSGGSGMALTSDGGFIMGPNTVSGNTHLMKFKPDGTIDWTHQVNLRGHEQIFRIIDRGSDGYAAVGELNNHALFVLADTSGVTGCADSTVTATLSNASVTIDTTYVPSRYNNINYDTYGITLTVTAKTLTNIALPCVGNDTCYVLSNGPMLCGNASPLFPSIVPEEINNCTDSTFFITSVATELYKAYRDSLIGSFEQDYINNCLQAGEEEHFSVAYNTSEYHYTLYYYDQAGNLVKTVPPAGVVINRSGDWLAAVKAARAAGEALPQVHNLVTQYRYNSLNQIVSQVTPDGGMQKFWYDRLGRMAVSQNARQAQHNAYNFTLYDAMGRITEVGELTSTEPMADAVSRNEGALIAWMGNVASSKTQITRTVYDIPYIPLEGIMNARNLRNRVSWTALYSNAADLDTSGYSSATFYNYDIHGNVDTLVQDYKRGAMADASNRFKKVVYNYNLIGGNINHVAYQPGMVDAFYHRYEYDAENRVISAETSKDSIYWEKDAYYQYYKHGALARSVIGQQQVQGIDYAYTISSWLKGVNSTTLTPEFDMGEDGTDGSLVAKDALGFALHYFGSRDYNAIGTSVKPFAEGADAGSDFRPLFNGNISAMSVNLPKLGEPLLYTYKYDVLNRIKGMQALNGLNATTNTWSPIVLPDFKESVSYDANGNILSYYRNGNNTFAGKPLGMDSLTYSYKPGSNLLDAISDDVSSGNYDTDIDNQSANNYSYDATGNLVADEAEGISSIEWTLAGKIKKIVKSNNVVIQYTYDVLGNRISKDVNGHQTWYVRDASGNIMSVYTKGNSGINSGQLTQLETYLYGSARLGVYAHSLNVEQIALPSYSNVPGLGNGIITNFTCGLKFFELNNHLGNVLATVTDKKRAVSTDGATTDHYEADIASMHDYYPFGMQMVGRGFNESNYRFGFNGKENDNEVKGEGNQQDYGMRIYDPRVGRFLSVDPLTKSYPWYTPYQFAGNMPILFIDLDGAEPSRNPDAPGYKENAAIFTVTAILRAATKEHVFQNLISKGFWTEDLKGTYACRPNGAFVTDTDDRPAQALNLYVNNGAVYNVDETNFNKFNDYEIFVVSELLGGFSSGYGPENYNFPVNGKISSKFFDADIFKAALNEYKSGVLAPNETKQYSFGLPELGKDALRNFSFYSITGFAGSAEITFSPTAEGVDVKIFNVTSLSSGALIKIPDDLTTFPRSSVRDPEKRTPFGNISQTFNLFIPKDSPLLEKKD